MKIPVIYMDCGALQCHLVKSTAPGYYEIPLKQPRPLSGSQTTQPRARCAHHMFLRAGCSYVMYIDISIDLNDSNTHNAVFSMSEVINYRNKIANALTQTLTNKAISANTGSVEYEYWAPNVPEVKPKCECGKEKHGFTNHTDWCPCYEEKNNE